MYKEAGGKSTRTLFFNGFPSAIFAKVFVFPYFMGPYVKDFAFGFVNNLSDCSVIVFVAFF